jgi:hypothetical protein
VNFNVDWAQLAEIATVVSIVGGIGLVIVRRWLHSEFVGHGEHRLLAGRVEKMELAKGTAVNRDEFQQLSDRVGRVETGIAVVQAGVTSTGESVRGIDRKVDLLLENALAGEKK